MKLKYYLRGLGIGIIVTAVIMGVASASRKETLSDREIRERAAELGMVEQSGSLAEMAQQESETTPEAEKAEAFEEIPSESPEASKEPAVTQTPAVTAAKEPEETPKATTTKEPEETPKVVATEEPVEEVKTVVVEIKSGDGSYTVCQKLEQKELIASASDFDTYLCSNGYDRKLRTGSHEIPADAKPEEIAKILCGMK